MCHAVPEDLLHAFFSSPSSRAVGDLLLSYAQLKVPRLSPQKLLRLDFGPGLDETDQLAIICIISTALKYIWQARTDKKVVTQHKIRVSSQYSEKLDLVQVQTEF